VQIARHRFISCSARLVKLPSAPSQRTPPLDLLFKLANGEWFHSDDRYAAFGDMLRGNERFVVSLVLECVLETMNVAIDLDNALRVAAWVPDLPRPTPR